VVNQLLTALPQTTDYVNLYRAPGDNTLYAFGRIAAQQAPQDFKLSIADPARYAGHLLLKALTKQGIRVKGQLRRLHWPQDDVGLRRNTVILGEVLSPPLGDILKSGLKRSQNLYLQNLFQLAGEKENVDSQQDAMPAFTTTTSVERGSIALRKLLDRVGIPGSASLIEEGTGLSRRDLSTPNALVRLLTYLAAQPYAGTLRDDLPIAGVDGTLEFRMRDTPAQNNVHAKTGSMRLVNCLAGYVTTATGERLAFAIMLNNYAKPDHAPSSNQDVDAIAVMLAGLNSPRKLNDF
jgi:D-alanyl-D-alanine carboxypeptidase/D-alanyl-D-alanine-endopeptidase (penicillin-binding protein 4)